MGNGIKRASAQVRHCTPISGIAFVAALACLCIQPASGTNAASTSTSQTCDSNINGGQAVYRALIQVRGEKPVIRHVDVPSDSPAIVFAEERDVDVTLEVRDESRKLVGIADNPVRRTGVQRVQLPGGPHHRYEISVIGKDLRDSNGAVELRIVSQPASQGPADACVAAEKILARADSFYAAGQAITRAPTGGRQVQVSPDKEYRDAAASYKQTAEILQASGPSALLAQTELAQASLLDIDGDDYLEAREWADKAVKTFTLIGDDYGAARARAVVASVMIDLAVSGKTSAAQETSQPADSMLAQARAVLEQAAAFQASKHHDYDEAWARNNIGLAFYYAGHYDEAIQAYQQALAPYGRIRFRVGEAQVHQNIALVEYELGRLTEASRHFQQTLKLISRDENPKLVARVLGNSALASRDLGQSDRALQELNDSLALARSLQDSSQEAVALHHLGSVYASLGDEDRASDSYRQALGKFQSLRHGRGQTACLRALANILRHRGHAAESLDLDRQALALAATSASRPPLLVQVAKDLISLHKPEEASSTLNQVLDDVASDEVDRARALQQRAVLRASTGTVREAESDLLSALNTFRNLELPLDEFDAWVDLARLRRRGGDLDQAINAIDHALALAESIRLQSANPELRSTVLQPMRPAFELKISILAGQYAAARDDLRNQQSLATRALATAEEARTRALSDYQGLDMNAPGLDPALIARRKDLYRELAGRRLRLEAILDGGDINGSQSQAIRAEISQLRQELDGIDARIGSASEKSRAQPTPGNRQTAVALARVPPGVAVIEYFVGEQESFAWVVTRKTLFMASLGDSARIGAAAHELHDSLRGFGRVAKTARLAAAEKMYNRVIRPLEGEFGPRDTLIFAPDGALHYVPFATLRHDRDGRTEYLIESHDIATTPSIQLFLLSAPARVAPASLKSMLLVADPVYDPADARLSRSASRPHPVDTATAHSPDPSAARADRGLQLALVRGPSGTTSLPRLPGAAREAALIESLMPPGSVDRLEGVNASRERFLEAGLERYRLIHVASHASTDSETPQASALILSTVDADGNPIDGRLLGADLMGVRLNADSVVLSGCDTALGKDVAGEGLMGLEYAVVARGARSVISSLWPAIDSMTARLMRDFYSALTRQHASVVSAWSAAARAALNGPYSDPGTWGAFVLTLSHVQDLQTPADNPPSPSIHAQRGQQQ